MGPTIQLINLIIDRTIPNVYPNEFYSSFILLQAYSDQSVIVVRFKTRSGIGKT